MAKLIQYKRKDGGVGYINPDFISQIYVEEDKYYVYDRQHTPMLVLKKEDGKELIEDINHQEEHLVRALHGIYEILRARLH